MSSRQFRRSRERQFERKRSKATLAAGAGLGATVLFAPAAEAATIEVTSLADDGSGGTTLREAIIEANGNGEADVITFAAGLTGAIELTSDLELYNEALEIRGPGANVITLDGQNGDNVFYLFSFNEPSTPVSISGLTVTGGNDGNGGGIESRPGSDEAAALTLSNMVITGNYASLYGGGVYASGGSHTITDSVISDNEAVRDGGGVYSYDADGDVRIERSVISGNESGNQAGGASIYDANGAVTVVDSTFADNTTFYGGGGATFYDNDGLTLVSRSTFVGNTAEGRGGGMILWGSNGATLVENTTVSGNTSDSESNGAGQGGGIYSYNRDIGPNPDVDTERTIRNSTIVNNRTGDAPGGGLFAYLYNEEGGPGDILDVSSTIIANNSAPEEPDIGDNDTGTEKGTFSIGFSLIENTGDAAIAGSGPNITGVDPQLGPLQNNGGPTQTHLPSFTSPVLDQGLGNGLGTDQRGAPRTFDAINRANATGGDGTDIGSVELLPGNRLALAQCRGKVENLLWAPGAPITGTDANDVIVGTPAKDRISSARGKDTICAEKGNDAVKSGAGKDRAFGAGGKDRLKGNGGNDKLSGQGGRDTLKGGGGKDTLKGGGGKDKLRGGPGRDRLRGGAGRDSERQ